MHIFFTDKEKEWLDTAKTFAWTIKEKCPPQIKEVLAKKLELLNKNKEGERHE